MSHDCKCNMDCFNCILPDCRQNITITPEESEDIYRWLPEGAKSRKRRNYDKRTVHGNIGE